MTFMLKLDFCINSEHKADLRLSRNNLTMSFPGGLVVKNLPANAEDLDLIVWVGKIPWRRKWQLSPVFLPGDNPWTEEHGRLQSPRGHKESDMTERLNTHAV